MILQPAQDLSLRGGSPSGEESLFVVSTLLLYCTFCCIGFVPVGTVMLYCMTGGETKSDFKKLLDGVKWRFRSKPDQDPPQLPKVALLVVICLLVLLA
jgi:hypothetical protein